MSEPSTPSFQGMCHYIGQLSKASKAGMRAALADCPKCHFNMLEGLLHAINCHGKDGAIYVSDLAREIRQPLPAVSRGLRLMEQDGTVVREPVQSVRLECTVHNPILTDGPTWDCAAVSLRAIDQNGNLLPYCGEAVQLSVEGPVKILGPAIVPLRGGMAGTYLATTGEAGRAVLHCRMEGALDVEAALTVRKRSGAENAN